jgi:hypothetical protein
LIFEGGILFLFTKLLSQEHRLLAVSLYALNPLVIIELTGNAHPEGIMLFFILLMFVLLQKGQFRRAALSLASAIATKLIPILLVPFLWRRLDNKRWSFMFYTIIGCAILFIPVYATSAIDGYFSSIALYFRQFEFNAFVYSIVKNIAIWIQGYHEIAITGPVLAFIAGTGIMIYSAFEKKPALNNLPFAILIAWTVYLFFSTTVHPWYICPLIALGILTGLYYPIVWSALIFVSYSTYRVTPPDELSGWIAMEYAVVTTFFITELWRRRKANDLKNKSDQRKTLTAFELFSTYLRKINMSKGRAPS